MKSSLFVCLLAAAIMAARGSMDMYPFNDETLAVFDKLEDPASDGSPTNTPTAPDTTTAPDITTAPDTTTAPDITTASNTDAPTEGGDKGPNPHGCECDTQCHKLHNDRLPKYIQDEHKYLSYENFPVLCRDASAILLPPEGKPQKKYVCKQVFDCCRKCNWLFYKCLATKPNTYGFCMRGAYKCMCDCIDNKSYKELPYNPAPHGEEV